MAKLVRPNLNPKFDTISVISFDPVEPKLEELKENQFKWIEIVFVFWPMVTICKSKKKQHEPIEETKKLKTKETFAAGWRFNNSRSSTNIVKNRILKPRNAENVEKNGSMKIRNEQTIDHRKCKPSAWIMFWSTPPIRLKIIARWPPSTKRRNDLKRISHRNSSSITGEHRTINSVGRGWNSDQQFDAGAESFRHAFCKSIGELIDLFRHFKSIWNTNDVDQNRTEKFIGNFIRKIQRSNSLNKNEICRSIEQINSRISPSIDERSF